MRTMKLTHKKHGVVYESVFDEDTGAIVRTVHVFENHRSVGDHDRDFAERYRHRQYSSSVFSPVPETVDVSITDQCSMGCPYCYMGSKPRDPHAPKELVETILLGFDTPPYQIAIGGGEPTQHPDLPYILRKAREIGTVPNYTTAGHAMTSAIVEATNEVCGGVAVTYHAFKGVDWFAERYLWIRDRLKVQLNVHLIADRNVAENLQQLNRICEKIGPLNLVLLAYYPDVGRASMGGIMPKSVYDDALPRALEGARRVGTKIAFSEGLLPYFLSRPELGVATEYAMPSEGNFSCYFDSAGRISNSSFSPPRDGEPTVWSTTKYGFGSQKMWDELHTYRHSPGGEACDGCSKSSRCSAPHPIQLYACAYQPHNKASAKSGARSLRVIKGD